jgi:hypothetical protein
MPDPARQTVSATESPALLGASPYITRWMLWQRFANGIEAPREVNSRMQWGLDMQPLIIKRVASDRKMEAIPNEGDSYFRRGVLGCTRDATIVAPDIGPGALEIKCVFDYETWARRWNNGATVPRDIELQLQQQMYVGDPGGESYKWGLIAVWVCADLYYFERKPIGDVWSLLKWEAANFLNSVKRREEPDPAGVSVEAPLLRELFPTRPDSVLDLSDDTDHVKSAERVSMYKTMKEQATGCGAVAEEERLKLFALAKGNQFVKLPCGVSYRVQKSGKGYTIIPYVPDVPLPPPPPKHDIAGIL